MRGRRCADGRRAGDRLGLRPLLRLREDQRRLQLADRPAAGRRGGARRTGSPTTARPSSGPCWSRRSSTSPPSPASARDQVRRRGDGEGQSSRRPSARTSRCSRRSGSSRWWSTAAARRSPAPSRSSASGASSSTGCGSPTRRPQGGGDGPHRQDEPASWWRCSTARSAARWGSPARTAGCCAARKAVHDAGRDLGQRGRGRRGEPRVPRDVPRRRATSRSSRRSASATTAQSSPSTPTTVAAAVAVALGAPKLIYLTDVPGILDGRRAGPPAHRGGPDAPHRRRRPSPAG